MKRYKLFFFLASFAVESSAVFSSCTEDIDAIVRQGGYLNIYVSDINANNDTRADYSGLITTFASGDQIGLYVLNGKGTTLVENVCYTFNGTTWTTSADVEYNSNYSYYAYFPYTDSPYSPNFTASGVDNIFAAFISDNSDKFHKADQSSKANYQASDLMIALGTDEGSNTVSFQMAHKKGLAVFEGEDALEADYSGNIPFIMGDKCYFLMKPSTNTSFCGGDYTLNASSGRYVTQNIGKTLNEYTLSVSAPNDYSYNGGSETYSVISYRSNNSGTKHKAANWTATFSEDGGATFSSTKPSWLTAFTDAGDGNADMSASNYTATVDAQTPSVTVESSSESLRNATPVSDYDLSLHTVSGAVCEMTTANCYMVHAPGTYRLPLVYGNAIKDGNDNTLAYMPGSVDNGVANFVNHADVDISAPWITKSGSGVNGGMGITVDGAQLIWQDVDGLTTDYAIDGDYLTFSVPAATIEQGNAVIAVKSGSTIVWSWHIWVTPETFASTTDIDTGSHTYTVTPVNVGWAITGDITRYEYDERSCIVKITQAGGLEETFTITQTTSINETDSRKNNNPYFQWGRKDPFVPAYDQSDNTDKTVYIGDGVPTKGYKLANTTATIGTNIQNPWIHYYSYSTRGPVSSTYYNMWDAQQLGTENISTATKKTIYDPCPPGYCIPTDNLFYYISNSGSNNASYGTWDSTNIGRTWIYGGAELFFPATGSRVASNAGLVNVGSYGYYWSASANFINASHRMSISSNGWTCFADYRSASFAVRAVAEN